MTLPRVAVIGSCVTRDPFNRWFFPTYKSRVKLVSCVYQTSLPSVVRTTQIRASLPTSIRPYNMRHIREEFDGRVIEVMLDSRPDIVVVDFYADVHFGVTTIDGQLVTRNHMAFSSSGETTAFFQDERHSPSHRGRFENGTGLQGEYQKLAEISIQTLLEQVQRRIPHALLVLNPARFSMSYARKDAVVVPFPNERRLAEKNLSWAGFDNLFEKMTGCERISYPDSVFVGSMSHVWGINPVHYAQAYYDHFWDGLASIADV
jgi:hypothetical protein